MQRCDPSGMFLLSVCVDMFDFGMLKYYHLLSVFYVRRHVSFWHDSVSSFACKDVVLPACFFVPTCFRMFHFGMFTDLSSVGLLHTHTHTHAHTQR